MWIPLQILEGKTDNELQRRTNYFLDLLQRLDEMRDICGIVNVLGGLNDFHVKRLKEKIWVEFMTALSLDRSACRRRRWST